MKKIVIGFSGGMDSTTLLAILLAQGFEVHCCSFNYGSKHNEYENKAAKNIIQYYLDLNQPVKHYLFDLQGVFKDFKSNLLKTGGDIPEGHYEGKNMKLTVVPGRNLIMASIMAGLAESIEAESIALGIHAGDHAIYPDCRPEFAENLDLVLRASTEGKVKVITPLLYDDKTSILKQGYSLEIPTPYDLTRTCYKDQVFSCGKCGSCQERLEAFENIGIKDPILYE